MGIDNYLNELIGVLEEIGAHKYAMIEKKYGKKLWGLYLKLENDEIHEDEFYNLHEKATDEYYKLNDDLTELLNTYLVANYLDFIEIIED